jgi:hypothetical protein
MYNWVFIMFVLTSKGPEPVFQKQYVSLDTCQYVSAVMEAEFSNLSTACVPVYRTDGGAWKKATGVHNGI